MSIRDEQYRREALILQENACFSKNTKGRRKPMPPDEMRTDFQRDRDRIIHCKSFRRLMHKTQVFLSPEDDHYTTRLTHTLEVAQIARTIARTLMLNEDLAEAIALGHDLGHTPFGHAGERLLDTLVPSGFRHYEQSLRVVDILEDLNLTYEVRNGIVNHAGKHKACTMEGQIVKYADRIAYLNHDIDDACRASVISENDIPLLLKNVLGYNRGERIDTMVKSVVQYSRKEGKIGMDDEIGSAMMELRELLFKMVYTNPIAKGEEERAESMLKQLYEFYLQNIELLPPQYRINLQNDPAEVCVADYIAGMTDRYAIYTFKKLFIPKEWQIERS